MPGVVSLEQVVLGNFDRLRRVKNMVEELFHSMNEAVSL